jgi:non-specific serine/threonine protein kinase
MSTAALTLSAPPRERLFTLTGAPGIGKTRLALAAAHAVWEVYAQGAWFVDLSSVRDPRLVAPRVLSVLDRGRPLEPTPPSGDILAMVTARLAHWEALLLLDHCDETADACAELARTVLAECPQVRILATAHLPLGVEGEHEWAVAPLNAPPTAAGAEAGDLSTFSALECFVAAAPAFALSAENTDAVADLCRWLGGNPLALRLVAGEVGNLPPDIILTRIDCAGPPIAGGDLDPGLRAGLELRYSRLGEGEQILLRRLAVGRGGLPLSAALALVSDTGARPREIRAQLERLVYRSLLLPLTDGPETRYDMLEPLRVYGAEQLAARRETITTRRLHLAWCLETAEAAERGADGPDWLDWSARLDAEHDNMREALAWEAGEAGDEQRLHLAAALGWYRTLHGHAAEGRRDLERLLAEVSTASLLVRAQARHALGRLVAHQGDLDMATMHYREALDQFEQADDHSGQAAVLASLGELLLDQNDLAGAERLYERSAEWWRRAGNQEREADSLNQLGLIAFGRGNPINAMAYYDDALRIFRQAENRRGILWSLIGQAGIDAVSGDAGNAARALREALQLLAVPSGNQLQLCLIVTAALAAGRGDAAWAAHFLGAASTAAHSSRMPLPRVYQDLAERWKQEARRALSHETFVSEWEAGGDLDAEASVAEALSYLGGIEMRST